MIAHIRKSDGAAQPLEAHCLQVAQLCETTAEPLGLGRMARLLGLLHDMGKATPAFEAYLRAAQDNPSTPSPHYHAPVGARFVYRRWFCAADAGENQRLTAQLLALCLYGHHTGLMDCLDKGGHAEFLTKMEDGRKLPDDKPVAWFCEHVRSEAELDMLFTEAQAEVAAFEAERIRKQTDPAFHRGMLARLLLSILVDADRWDAACFEYGAPGTPPHAPDWAARLAAFEAYRTEHLRATDEIGYLRAAVSDQCAARAAEKPGVYTLSVPTGGGKTYASLRYALRHAAIHQKQRIFYLIPYNTILDQNAKDIRAALADDPSILEHHSDVVKESPEEQTAYRRLTERWDSNIILTSLVQFLDACFAASNTDARRLHRLSNAVLIFDEIQALPKHCKRLFEQAIQFLAGCCGSTVLLCTATQPRLNLTPSSRELVPDCEADFRGLRRVDYYAESQKLHNDEAAARLAAMLAQRSVLAIVNTRKTARELYQETITRLSAAGIEPVTAQEGCTDEQIAQRARQCGLREVLCVYLSTLLCPAHRKTLLRWVRIWLREGARMFCASTALIEAGINVSFPVVVRSLAGIPSIVQAAGRANRSLEYETGMVYIWELLDDDVSNLEDIRRGRNMTRSILEEIPASELDTRKVLDGYFAKEANEIRKQELYPIQENQDKENRNHDTLYGLLAGQSSRDKSAMNFRQTQKLMLRQSFATAYRAFRVIPQETIAVLTPYGEGAQLIARLRGAKTMAELTWLLRQAQNYCATLYTSEFERLRQAGAIQPLGDTGLDVLAPEYYDTADGVRTE